MSNGHVRMGTAYAPNAASSAQGDAGWRSRMGDVRADDARLRLGDVRADDAMLRLGDVRADRYGVKLGTAYAPAASFSAQGSRVEQLGGVREDTYGIRMGAGYADDASAGAFQSRMSGLGARAHRMVVGRPSPGGGGGGSGSFNASASYKNRDQYTRGSSPRPTMQYDVPASAIQLYASGANPSMMNRHMNGLREGDASIRLGDVRADDAGLRLGAADFHARFPVKITMAGLGSGTHMLSKAQIAGLFDFLKSNPSDADNYARVQAITNWWMPVRNAIGQLSAAKQQAAIAAIGNLDTSVSDIDFVVANYPNTAAGGWTREHMNRMTRIEAAEPAINKLLSDMQIFNGPNAAAGAAANGSILKTVNGQANAIESSLTVQNLAVAVVGTAAGIGVIWALVKAFQQKN